MAARNATPIGEKFNFWTITGDAPTDRKRRRVYARCDCGAVKALILYEVITGKVKSCGCLARSKFPDPEIGFRSGKLVVTGPFATLGESRMATCKCDCGAQYDARTSQLRNASVFSCGCMQVHRTSMKHGHTRIIDGKRSRTYTIWINMRNRCSDPKNKRWSRYGGRGISVCERWQSFENFLADMGEATAGLTLERIRVNEGYSADNCKWATHKEQANNMTNNRRLAFDGENLTIAEWNERIGISYTALYQRINSSKWSVEKALTEPIRKNQYD